MALDAALVGLRLAIREVVDRFEFEFPADPSTFQTAAEWAILERRCCPFFDIQLRLEREEGPFTIPLTGRDGVKESIKAELRPKWFR